MPICKVHAKELRVANTEVHRNEDRKPRVDATRACRPWSTRSARRLPRAVVRQLFYNLTKDAGQGEINPSPHVRRAEAVLQALSSPYPRPRARSENSTSFRPSPQEYHRSHHRGRWLWCRLPRRAGSSPGLSSFIVPPYCLGGTKRTGRHCTRSL